MKLFYKVSFTVLVTIFLISCNNKQPSKTQTKAGKIEVITPADFKEKSTNQLIIDVRTPGEFAQGHIKGATNIILFVRKLLEVDHHYRNIHVCYSIYFVNMCAHILEPKQYYNVGLIV